MKNMLSVLILNAILTIAEIILITYSCLQVNNIISLPFGINRDSASFSVTKNYSDLEPLNEDKLHDISIELSSAIKNQKITIVNDNISGMGLGVYDSARKYKTPDGKRDLFEVLDKQNILLRKGSYFEGSDSLETLSGNKMTVAGSFDDNYVLYKNNHEYIYNLFAEDAFEGDYYIECNNKSTLQKITDILKANGFSIKTINTVKSSSETIKTLLSNSLYTATLISFLFILLNLSLFYLSFLNSFKKRMRLHVIYGACFGDFLRSYLKRILLLNIFSVAAAILVYILIFQNSQLLMSPAIILVAALGSYVFNSAIFMLCICIKLSLRPKKLLAEI